MEGIFFPKFVDISILKGDTYSHLMSALMNLLAYMNIVVDLYYSSKNYTCANRPHVNKVNSVDFQSLKIQDLILRQLNMCIWDIIIGLCLYNL